MVLVGNGQSKQATRYLHVFNNIIKLFLSKKILTFGEKGNTPPDTTLNKIRLRKKAEKTATHNKI